MLPSRPYGWYAEYDSTPQISVITSSRIRNTEYVTSTSTISSLPYMKRSRPRSISGPATRPTAMAESASSAKLP